MNEDPRIISELARANEIHEQYQTDMTSSIKKISGLEIQIRKEKLKKEFLQLAFVLSEAQVIIKMTKDDTTSDCSRKNLAHLAALSAIACFPLSAATNLFLPHRCWQPTKPTMPYRIGRTTALPPSR